MHVQLTYWAVVSKKCFQLLGAAVPWLGPSCIRDLRRAG